jgi:hypothetical protein
MSCDAHRCGFYELKVIKFFQRINAIVLKRIGSILILLFNQWLACCSRITKHIFLSKEIEYVVKEGSPPSEKVFGSELTNESPLFK